MLQYPHFNFISYLSFPKIIMCRIDRKKRGFASRFLRLLLLYCGGLMPPPLKGTNIAIELCVSQKESCWCKRVVSVNTYVQGEWANIGSTV